MQHVKKFFKAFDLFGGPISLLHKENDNVRTVLGGIGTILLAIVFLGIFHAKIIGFFQLKFISYTSSIDADINLHYKINRVNTKFAVGITGYDMATQNDTLKLQAQAIERYSNGTLVRHDPIHFEPCRKEDWSSLGSSFEEYFEANKMRTYLCPTDYSFDIQGQYGTKAFKYLKIWV